VCWHRKRAAIEEALGRYSVPLVSQDFGISESSLYRHRSGHVGKLGVRRVHERLGDLEERVRRLEARLGTEETDRPGE
jgi:Transposase